MADAAIQRMRAAVLETRTALGRLRDEIATGEAALAVERRQRDDAERRGRMARDIGDVETAGLAERFTARHAERVAVLERKVAVLGEEAGLLERDLAEMLEQLDRAERVGGGSGSGARSSGSPTGSQPSADHVRTPAEESEILRARMDRAAREKAAEDQLAALKRKMGK